MSLSRILAFALAAWPLLVCASPIKVWVQLRDKGPASVSGRAGEDAPVYAPYLKQLQGAGFAPDVALKWQNKVSGWVEAEKLPALNRLPIVLKVEGMPRKAPYLRMPIGRDLSPHPFAKTQALSFGSFQTLFDTTQASALRASVATANQTAGQGMKVAIIDADFYLGHECFSHLKQASLIADQWDFVAHKSGTVRDTLAYSHGASVLSLLGGKSSTFEGLVPEAKFLLYRSENEASETYVEEDYVAAAIERAVDSGAKVISISLGYRYGYSDSSPDLPYAAMNGRTRPSSLAALGAARRNVLVSVSMGNEGPTLPSGPTISAPADADSILSVGILDMTLKPCSYSSTGPTYDKRVKPEVASIGPVSCTTPTANSQAASGVVDQGGTSFAAPVVAGIAALLRQLHPALSAQMVRLALIATAGKTSHPDSASGYGLVRAKQADSLLSIPASVAQLEKSLTAPDQGMISWMQRSRRATLTWKPGVDPSVFRLWDMKGRNLPIQAGGKFPGVLDESRRQSRFGRIRVEILAVT